MQCETFTQKQTNKRVLKNSDSNLQFFVPTFLNRALVSICELDATSKQTEVNKLKRAKMNVSEAIF